MTNKIYKIDDSTLFDIELILEDLQKEKHKHADYLNCIVETIKNNLKNL